MADLLQDAIRERKAKSDKVFRNPLAVLRAAGHIPGTVDSYLARTDLDKFGRDVATIGGMVYDSAKEDFSGFMRDAVLAPWSAMRDVGDVRDAADKLRAAGQDDAADKMEQMAVLAVFGGVPILGVAAGSAARRAVSRAVKSADRGLDKLTPLATRVESKLPVQRVPAAAAAPDLDSLRVILSNSETNPAARAADDYTRSAFGRGYDRLAVNPPASLEKQSGIARAFRAGAEDNPGYKHAVFEQYGKTNPEMVDRSGAQNYDQLVERAYDQFGKETRQQFDTMPVDTIMHAGGGDYGTPSNMIRDVLAEGRLNTFRGGDAHPLLGDVDPSTGLSSNEMFRAVHDYYGHVPQGNTFRAPGEEAAYASHSQMMSPLAQLALAAETRGQNSFTNFSPVNAKLVGGMEDAKAALSDIKKARATLQSEPSRSYKYADAKKLLANAEDPEVLKRRLRELGSQFQFAPQRPLLLPPEHVAVDTQGGVPSYLRSLIVPRKGLAADARGVHMSQRSDLSVTDPSFFGTGHRGAEYADVASGSKGVPNRTYFYTGSEGTVDPEQVLFARGDRTPYEANLSGLYDMAADPEGLVSLANAYRREGSPANQFDRMAREYGYGGTLGGGPSWGTQRPAAVFDPVRVRRLAVKPGHKGYAEGGLVA